MNTPLTLNSLLIDSDAHTNLIDAQTAAILNEDRMTDEEHEIAMMQHHYEMSLIYEGYIIPQ